MNKYVIENFGIELPTTVKAEDLANPSKPLGKIWADFIGQLDRLGAAVTGNAHFVGGTTNIALPTKVIAGVR